MKYTEDDCFLGEVAMLRCRCQLVCGCDSVGCRSSTSKRDSTGLDINLFCHLPSQAGGQQNWPEDVLNFPKPTMNQSRNYLHEQKTRKGIHIESVVRLFVVRNHNVKFAFFVSQRKMPA